MSSLNHLPPPPSPSAKPTTDDTLTALTNLATLQTRMDSLHNLLFDSLNHNTLLSAPQIHRVNSELTHAIHQLIINGATLLSSTLSFTTPPHLITHPHPNYEVIDVSDKDGDKIHGHGDIEIVELDAVELLAEHIHFCDICGKGFKRDANLRMHMRAHGNQFKSRESLSKPDKPAGNHAGKTRFSCPYNGCNRNRRHGKFRPLKSVICVKNHFKRSHCPKTYACERCNKKSFSVMGDLKSHMKSCGNSKWRCSCGTSFSRKDKLFGHMALFEGHMPAVMAVADETAVIAAVGGGGDDELLLLEDFGSADNQCLQELMMEINASSSSNNAHATHFSFISSKNIYPFKF